MFKKIFNTLYVFFKENQFYSQKHEQKWMEKHLKDNEKMLEEASHKW